MTDVVHEISATRRVVGTRVLAAGEARTVTISRIYNAPLEDLWDACTNPGHIAHVDNERWAQYGPGAVGVGWDLAILGLSLHLSGELLADPMAWSASAEGHEYMTRSSTAWTEASIASGTDPEAARAVGNRTTAFYAGGGEH